MGCRRIAIAILLLSIWSAGAAWGFNSPPPATIDAPRAAPWTSIPRAAKKFLPQVVREARYRNLDPAIAAGQIHQESRWDGSAASPYAAGLAQFTPQTEAWAKAAFPKDLGNGVGSLDPRWAVRAMCAYDRWLLDRTAQDYAATLRAYNGGLGYIFKERTCHRGGADTPVRDGRGAAMLDSRLRGNDSATFDCCRRFRSAASCRENLDYPEKILNRWAPIYRAVLNPFARDTAGES